MGGGHKLWTFLLISSICGAAILYHLEKSNGGSAILAQMYGLSVLVFFPGIVSSVYSATYGYGMMMLLMGLRSLSSLYSLRISKFYTVRITSWSQFYDQPIFSPSVFFDSGDEGFLWWGCLMQSIIYILYGARMVLFHFSRSFSKSFEGYKTRYAEYCCRGKETPFKCTVVAIMIGVFSAWLYLPLAHCLLNLEAHIKHDFSNLPDSFGNVKGLSNNSGWCIKSLKWLQFFGVVLALFMLIVEHIADRQKQAAKETNVLGKTRASNKNKYVTTGLFSYTQHPNYLAEMDVQLGLFLAAIPGLGWNYKVWLTAGTPNILLLICMCEAVANMQSIHQAKYGDEPGYSTYRKSTPVYYWGIRKMLRDSTKKTN